MMRTFQVKRGQTDVMVWTSCLVAEHCWDPVGQAIVDYAYYFERLQFSVRGEK
jgi:hypothetical protein